MPKHVISSLDSALVGCTNIVKTELPPGRASTSGVEPITIGISYANPKTHVTIRYNISFLTKRENPRPQTFTISEIQNILKNDTYLR